MRMANVYSCFLQHVQHEGWQSWRKGVCYIKRLAACPAPQELASCSNATPTAVRGRLRPRKGSTVAALAPTPATQDSGSPALGTSALPGGRSKPHLLAANLRDHISLGRRPATDVFRCTGRPTQVAHAADCLFLLRNLSQQPKVLYAAVLP